MINEMIRTSSGVRFGIRPAAHTADGKLTQDHARITQESDDLITEKPKNTNMVRHYRRGHPIRQYTIDGQLVREWQSVSSAAAALDTYDADIRKAIHSHYKTAKGFRWAFVDDDHVLEDIASGAAHPARNKPGPTSPRINQYTMDGTFIRAWESYDEIVQALGIRKPGISLCIHGAYNSYKGYVWRADENE